MANFVAGVISLTLGVIMVASVLIPQVKGTNTSTWEAGEVALWGVVSLGAIIGIWKQLLGVFSRVFMVPSLFSASCKDTVPN